MMNKKNHILLELILGIIILGIVTQIICLIVSKNYLYDAIGLWSGVFLAGFCAIHMKCSIEDALDLGETNATKKVRGAYAFRMGIVLLVVGCIIYFKLGNYVTLLISMFFLKLSAYLQPLTHKIVNKIPKLKEEG